MGQTRGGEGCGRGLTKGLGENILSEEGGSSKTRTRTCTHSSPFPCRHSQSIGFSLPVCVILLHVVLPLTLWSPPTPPRAKNGASPAREWRQFLWRHSLAEAKRLMEYPQFHPYVPVFLSFNGHLALEATPAS